MLDNYKKNKVDAETLANIQLLQKIKDSLWEIKKCYSDAPKSKIAKEIKDICKTTDLILKEVSLKQDKIPKVTVLSDFYLPTLIKMIKQYTNIQKNNLTGPNCTDIQLGVEEMMPQINTAFKNLLDTLYGAENLDIETDMKVMLYKFKQRRLLDD